ncbi:MAG: zinc ABC transporter substrate-binding protein [Cyclobacteriaceae bacterium]|nr:zinc ABC transporter substrate-binding protein [Cyclobacteriaceae bacterium]
MKRKILKILILSIIIFSNCNSNEKKSTSSLPIIVTTTGMLADAVENIVGDSAKVSALMGPGVDPHLYKASQGDLTQLTNADIIIYNGLHLEGKMGEVLENLGRLRPVIAGGEGIPKEKIRNSTQYKNAYDPHVWFDVSLWQIVVQYLSTELQNLHPANADYYKNNTNLFLDQLDSLHQKVTHSIATIPDQQKILITAHDAFEYFGDAYGIEVKGLQGISTVSEFGLRDITDLVDFIVEKQIKAVFVETSVSKKAINAVVEGCNNKGFKVLIGGSLYSDAMGEKNTPEGTYIGMVNKNVTTITNALK